MHQTPKALRCKLRAAQGIEGKLACAGSASKEGPCAVIWNFGLWGSEFGVGLRVVGRKRFAMNHRGPRGAFQSAKDTIP